MENEIPKWLEDWWDNDIDVTPTDKTLFGLKKEAVKTIANRSNPKNVISRMATEYAKSVIRKWTAEDQGNAVIEVEIPQDLYLKLKRNEASTFADINTMTAAIRTAISNPKTD